MKINWKMVHNSYVHSKASLKQIAAKYHINYGTLKGHKFRHHWTRNHVSSKDMARQLDQSGLNSRNKLFCALWLKDYDATKDYRKVYHCKLSTAQVNGSRLLRRPKIQRQLTKLRREQVTNLHIDRSDVLERLIEMFFMDVSDYCKYGHKTCTDPDTNEQYQRSYLYFRNDPINDTSLLNGIRLGQDGANVQMPDKVRVAKLLLEYLPDPVNHDVHTDTLVMALLRSVQNANNKK